MITLCYTYFVVVLSQQIRHFSCLKLSLWNHGQGWLQPEYEVGFLATNQINIEFHLYSRYYYYLSLCGKNNKQQLCFSRNALTTIAIREKYIFVNFCQFHHTQNSQLFKTLILAKFGNNKSWRFRIFTNFWLRRCIRNNKYT